MSLCSEVFRMDGHSYIIAESNFTLKQNHIHKFKCYTCWRGAIFPSIAGPSLTQVLNKLNFISISKKEWNDYISRYRPIISSVK